TAPARFSKGGYSSPAAGLSGDVLRRRNLSRALRRGREGDGRSAADCKGRRVRARRHAPAHHGDQSRGCRGAMSLGQPNVNPAAASGGAPGKATARVAVVCGGGSRPATVADALIAQGRGVVMFPLYGWADPAEVARFRHHWIHIGQLGRFSRLAHAEGCRDLVMIGTLVRPTVRQLRLGFETLRGMPRIIRAYRGGDDHLLSGVGRIREDYGFRLVGAHEVAPQILAPLGRVGHCAPTPRDAADITRALALLAAIGPFDVGQAAVVADGRVLAVEAAEGTDHMLAHLIDMRRRGRIPA